MARTSLARQLRSLAAEHRAAQELGWTPQQVHESGADVVRTELGRRGFLKGALGVAGLAALSSAGVALPAAAAGSRIAVVGAPPVPPAQATPENLQEIVARLRGGWK